jgi:signal transduction histidine kinase
VGRALSLPLERRLALTMSGVLVAILASSLLITYGTLTRSAEESTRRRIGPAAAQIAASAEASLVRRTETLQQWGADPDIQRTLSRTAALPDSVLEAGARAPHGPLATAALRAVTGHLTASDTLSALQLHDREGRLALALGPRSTLEDGHALDQALANELKRWRTGPAASVVFTPMHRAGDRYYFWTIVAVGDGSAPLGFIAQLLRVGGPPNVQTQLQELIGERVSTYLRNEDGLIWTAAPDSSATAPDSRKMGRLGMLHHRGDRVMIAEEAQIAGAPWLIVLETPLDLVHGEATRTVVRLALLSLLLVAAGAVLSFVIGRRIAEPLASITAAAGAIATGDYESRAGGGEHRRDEVGALATMFDQMASEVESTRRALQDQVAEAERARDEAERANRAKGDFLAVMSHELRTPLNAIGGYAQLLGMGVYGPVTAAQQDALSRLGKSQSHLLRLIDEVLNLAKINAGETRYRMARVPLTEVLEGLEPLVAPQMLEKGIRFELGRVDASVAAHADAEKLQQVLLNLLSNASKYTPEGGIVRVDCESDDHHVKIHVTDNGIGIASDRHASIFERFVQVERSLNRPSEGVGLGLTISRELARGMGGDLSVESSLGKGSVFTVTLARHGAGIEGEQPVNADRTAVQPVV